MQARWPDLPEPLDPFAPAADEPGPGRWAWFAAALLAGVVLFLATNNTVVGVILPVVAAGWNSFRTGLWLWKADPWRARGRVCLAFYTAAGCWKVAAAALLTVIVIGWLQRIAGGAFDLDQFAAIMLTMLAGVVFSSLIGLAATCAAAFGRMRVWVHPKLRSQLAGNLGSVRHLQLARPGFNHAVFVVATSLVFPPIVAGCVLLATVFTMADVRQNVGTFPVSLALVVMVGGPLVMILVYAWLSSRIIASSPQECWPDVAADGEEG